MRRVTTWLAAFTTVAAMSMPCQAAASLALKPSNATSFWAGTRLTLVAERASAGRLSVRVEGTVAVGSSARVTLVADGCAAGTDNISSYDWSPEHHPADRQAVPSDPAHLQSGKWHEMRVRDKRQVSYSATVSYGFPEAPRWTDCVTLSLWRNGGNGESAFSYPANTLYASVTLQDGRHVACGPTPAFCPLQRPAQFFPPALPAFPPAPGYPGSPGHGNPPGSTTPGGATYPYYVCGTRQTGGPFLCSAQQAAAEGPAAGT
jgi:hypothetical protein